MWRSTTHPLQSLSGGQWEVHKAAPVVLAEAVVEFPGSPGAAVYRLASEEIPVALEGIVATLCNVEGVAPPRTVVRIGTGEDVELAVSLRTPEEDPFRPYLLRFVRMEAEGGLKPLFGIGTPDEEVLPYLTVPDCGRAEWTVVSLLPKGTYEQKFSRYERIIPAFRERLLRRRGRERT